MAKILPAISALAIVAALVASHPAGAANYVTFYDLSPRQIADMLDDDGYSLRGPMIRRGQVYIVDVISITGQPERLVVDATDGNIIRRAVAAPHWPQWERDGEEDAPLPPRPIEAAPAPDRRKLALSEKLSQPSRVYGAGEYEPPKPEPSPRPRRHAHKPKAHESTPLVAEPDKPAPSATTVSAPPSAPAASPPPSVATLAPSAPSASPAPSVAALTPSAPTPKPSPESSKGAPSPTPSVTTAAAPPIAQPSKATTPARKKINDLPVGTLD